MHTESGQAAAEGMGHMKTFHQTATLGCHRLLSELWDPQTYIKELIWSIASPSCITVIILKILFSMKTSICKGLEPSMVSLLAELLVTKGNLLTANCQPLTRLFVNHILDKSKFDPISKGTSFTSPSASFGRV